MRLPDVLLRLLGLNGKPDVITRVDHLLENVDSVQIRIVPKNKRALAELRRLESHARR